jgi:O-antigen/teichoic acid export membrane protein
MPAARARALRFLSFGIFGIAAFQAAQGNWISAALTILLLGLFLAITVWRTGHQRDEPDPAETEARVRRLSRRSLPFFLIFFAGIAVYNLVDADWFGAGFAAVLTAGLLIVIAADRRQLSDG